MVVVLIFVYLGKFLEAKVAYSHHAIVTEAGTFDDVGGTAGTEYLTWKGFKESLTV